MYKMRCTGHFVPLWNVQISPPASKWRQFASTSPYVVGPGGAPVQQKMLNILKFASGWERELGLLANIAGGLKQRRIISSSVEDSEAFVEELEVTSRRRGL